MKMRDILGAVLAIATVTLPPIGAHALLAPQYYEQARREAPNVVVISIKAVTPPTGGYGDCTVAGEVRRVERGSLFRDVQAVTIGVPCVTPGAQPPLGGTIYQGFGTLSQAPFGRAYLDDKGVLMLSQFEPLAALP